MHTMFDWNRDKTVDLTELSHQLWDLKCARSKDDELRWYDADLSLSQSGDLL